MNTDLSVIDSKEGVYTARLADAGRLNRELEQQFAQARQASSLRQTHHFHGRFENTYVDRSLLPALEPLFSAALAHARDILERKDLKLGFWFNEMGPGHRTSLHAHEEMDELLSAVYYIRVPEGSGRLLLHLDDGIRHVEPEEGMFVFFPPDLPHEVETNCSEQVRLSLAMNFGPPDDD